MYCSDMYLRMVVIGCVQLSVGCVLLLKRVYACVHSVEVPSYNWIFCYQVVHVCSICAAIDERVLT